MRHDKTERLESVKTTFLTTGLYRISATTMKAAIICNDKRGPAEDAKGEFEAGKGADDVESKTPELVDAVESPNVLLEAPTISNFPSLVYFPVILTNKFFWLSGIVFSQARAWVLPSVVKLYIGPYAV